MKIAFIITSPIFVASDGVVSQALTWKTGLEDIGHEVILINMWKKNDWKEFDIIHLFSFNDYMKDTINNISKVNQNIVLSPILDPTFSVRKLKLFAHWGSNKLRLTNKYHALFSIHEKIKLVLVRSKFEKEYMVGGIGIAKDKCKVVPLAYKNSPLEKNREREPFCLHISLLTDERKNVKRLIDAAIKYNFKLILGGKLRNKEEVDLLNSWINNNANIEYHGFLSNEEMTSLYSRAKVFALPSTNEGVGIVALDAAAMGCDIVITNLGGPKEYYNNMAMAVDPYSVNDIGRSIKKLINGKTFQPELFKHIKNNYSSMSVSKKLLNEYTKIVNNSILGK
jgi:glycosyltransferase involved in cell wall biosynthesis